eukprot:scaffold57002_cov21-Tisochrysis_lutea.AAC.6
MPTPVLLLRGWPVPWWDTLCLLLYSSVFSCAMFCMDARSAQGSRQNSGSGGGRWVAPPQQCFWTYAAAAHVWALSSQQRSSDSAIGFHASLARIVGRPAPPAIIQPTLHMLHGCALGPLRLHVYFGPHWEEGVTEVSCGTNKGAIRPDCDGIGMLGRTRSWSWSNSPGPH